MRRTRRAFLFGAAASACAPRQPGGPVVNDITQLNPIGVAQIIEPRSVEHVAELISHATGAVSAGGGRFSQGGQIATEGALFLDMRALRAVLAIDQAARTITVQAGATWREIMEAIDPLDLSPKIMQSFFNFTVGGSLSVNCHGDYVGLGPLIESARALRIVLANGSIVTASRTENRDLFGAAIGGYGGVGVITEATLDLEANTRVERVTHRMSTEEYPAWHRENVLGVKDAVLHHAVIYPGSYQTVAAELSTRTDKPVTISDRLAPTGTPSSLDRFMMDMTAFTPIGTTVREHVYDPLTPSESSVSWRNYEAAGDAFSLEPASRARSTYVLQEYFVPADAFQRFAEDMARILKTRRANVLNIAIRHTRADPECWLAWAKQDCYSFVLYHEQRVHARAKAAVGVWTRELIDAALAAGGSYYLPYQIHATREQFLAAYPRASEFFALKARLDPTNKLRNRLWDAYYAP